MKTKRTHAEIILEAYRRAGFSKAQLRQVKAHHRSILDQRSRQMLREPLEIKEGIGSDAEERLINKMAVTLKQVMRLNPEEARKLYEAVNAPLAAEASKN